MWILLKLNAIIYIVPRFACLGAKFWSSDQEFAMVWWYNKFSTKHASVKERFLWDQIPNPMAGPMAPNFLHWQSPLSNHSISVTLHVFCKMTEHTQTKNTRKPSWRQVSARQPCVHEDLFLPSQRGLTPPPPAEERLAISTQSTSLKSTFSGLQIRRWQYESIFIRLSVIASEIREMWRNSNRIWPYSSSRSSKVIDLGVNGKPIYDFLLG